MSKLWLAGILAGILGSSMLLAQEAPKVKRIPARPTAATEGPELFRTYCAVCHGVDGRGGGPAAAALKVAPTDLTQLAAKNGGAYPELRVQNVLTSEEDQTVSAHGSSEMPIWGTIFRRMSSNQSAGSIRIYNLVKYLGTLQKK
ncbi:MAG TPA: c-type cytochrome [Bryobacteraceae bacterium]|jgi:mono/diheme cytochrome c family protein|nr:c-type cytochrome [Bryobacteraceae bacterium]